MHSMKPSKNHPNRRLHNFSVYNSSDRVLLKIQGVIRGDVYDLGCGEMPYKSWLTSLPEVTKYIGVDWGSTLHTLTADIVSDLNKPLPIPDSVADTIISLSVLEHLSEPASMLAEAHRILRKGGGLLIQVPWQWQIHEAPYDYFRYSPYGLKHLLERAGFKNVDVTPQAGFFTMWFLKLNYFLTRLIMGPRVVRTTLRLFFTPVWILGQLLAPFLDRLDRDWLRESPGYFVTAEKH